MMVQDWLVPLLERVHQDELYYNINDGAGLVGSSARTGAPRSQAILNLNFKKKDPENV